MKLKHLSLSLIAACGLATPAFADVPNTTPDNATCVPGNPTSSDNYKAVKWYRDSAERVAQYNQTFSIGQEKIAQKVKKDKLKKGQWGVIFDIDDTVLDNSQYEKDHVYSCDHFTPTTFYAFTESEISTATPGSVKLTCSIQKMGGKVVFVTNRDGTFDSKVQQATVDNLKAVGLCFDSVVFSNGEKDSNKTPRFMSIAAGNYESIIATNKQLKPMKVIAYFGDNIQDFPNIKQSQAIKESPDSSFYDKFGQEYFSLPNPRYGSWEANQFN